MKRSIVGIRVSFLLPCLLVAALVRFACPAAGLSEAAMVAPLYLNSFYFGEGYRVKPGVTGEALQPAWPAWLHERYISPANQRFVIPSNYQPERVKDHIQLFVHSTMQSVFVACGIYALVGGLGSKLANKVDDAAETVIWQTIGSTAKAQDNGKSSKSLNFRGY